MNNKRIKMMAERLFLFDPNTLMSVIVTVAGNVGTEELVKAVKKTYTQNQTTMSRFVLDSKGDLYLEEMEKSGCGVYVDGRGWQEIMDEYQRKAFRLNEGDLVRTFIIPKGQETDIYIMAHHLVCDGSALLILAEDILNNLTGKEVAYQRTKVLTKKGTIRKGDLVFKKRLGLRFCNYQWKKDRRVFGWDDYYRVHDDFWKNRKTEIDFMEISGDDLANLKQESKRLGITLNSYLFAKILQTVPESRNLGVPVSLRGGDRSISNLVSSVEVKYQYDLNKSVEDNAVILNQEIKKQLHNERAIYHISQFLSITDPTLVDAAMMSYIDGFDVHIAGVMEKLIGYSGDRKIHLGVTNLKEIQLPSDYGTFKITKIIPVAPCILSAEKVVTVSTYHGTMLIADSKIVRVPNES